MTPTPPGTPDLNPSSEPTEKQLFSKGAIEPPPPPPQPPALDEAREISPFAFSAFGNDDTFRDFSAVVMDAEMSDEEPEEVQVPKDGELPKPTSSSPETSGNSEPPVQVPPPLTASSQVNPATPPIPSSPSAARTTPPAS